MIASPTLARRVLNLIQRNWHAADIAQRCGLELADVEQVMSTLGRRDRRIALRLTAERMLRRVPAWWDRGESAWQCCVLANFGDVL